jgi:DNA-binding NarL/FixJ family response regulator
MPPIHVVLTRQDPALTDKIVASVKKQFLNVATVSNEEDTRHAIARTRAQLAIVDLEVVNFAELDQLCHEFPATAFVSIHRLADDGMWSKSLAAGAVDCCQAGDLPRILQASERYVAFKANRATSAA